MGPTLVLCGMLCLMMSLIWIVGEILKKDVILGIIAVVTFPIFSAYWTFFEDYNRCIKPFSIGAMGFTFMIVGRLIGW